MFRNQMLPRAVPFSTFIIVLAFAGLAISFELAYADEKLPEGQSPASGLTN